MNPEISLSSIVKEIREIRAEKKQKEEDRVKAQAEARIKAEQEELARRLKNVPKLSADDPFRKAGAVPTRDPNTPEAPQFGEYLSRSKQFKPEMEGQYIVKQVGGEIIYIDPDTRWEVARKLAPPRAAQNARSGTAQPQVPIRYPGELPPVPAPTAAPPAREPVGFPDTAIKMPGYIPEPLKEPTPAVVTPIRPTAVPQPASRPETVPVPIPVQAPPVEQPEPEVPQPESVPQVPETPPAAPEAPRQPTPIRPTTPEPAYDPDDPNNPDNFEDDEDDISDVAIGGGDPGTPVRMGAGEFDDDDDGTDLDDEGLPAPTAPREPRGAAGTAERPGRLSAKEQRLAQLERSNRYIRIFASPRAEEWLEEQMFKFENYERGFDKLMPQILQNLDSVQGLEEPELEGSLNKDLLKAISEQLYARMMLHDAANELSPSMASGIIKLDKFKDAVDGLFVAQGERLRQLIATRPVMEYINGEWITVDGEKAIPYFEKAIKMLETTTISGTRAGIRFDKMNYFQFGTTEEEEKYVKAKFLGILADPKTREQKENETKEDYDRRIALDDRRLETALLNAERFLRITGKAAVLNGPILAVPRPTLVRPESPPKAPHERAHDSYKEEYRMKLADWKERERLYQEAYANLSPDDKEAHDFYYNLDARRIPTPLTFGKTPDMAKNIPFVFGPPHTVNGPDGPEITPLYIDSDWDEIFIRDDLEGGYIDHTAVGALDKNRKGVELIQELLFRPSYLWDKTYGTPELRHLANTRAADYFAFINSRMRSDGETMPEATDIESLLYILQNAAKGNAYTQDWTQSLVDANAKKGILFKAGEEKGEEAVGIVALPISIADFRKALDLADKYELKYRRDPTSTNSDLEKLMKSYEDTVGNIARGVASKLTEVYPPTTVVQNLLWMERELYRFFSSPEVTERLYKYRDSHGHLQGWDPGEIFVSVFRDAFLNTALLAGPSVSADLNRYYRNQRVSGEYAYSRDVFPTKGPWSDPGNIRRGLINTATGAIFHNTAPLKPKH